MKRFFAAIALLLLAASSADPRSIHGAAAGGGSCTTNGNDGFAGAPAGTAQLPNFFSGYAVRPSWCVAGVDYHIGIDRTTYPTDANLKDPASASLPSGVSRDATNQWLNITGNNVTMDGWDMSLHGGWSFVYANGISNLTIKNSKWFLGTFQNTVLNGSKYQIMLGGDGNGDNAVTNLTFMNNEVDGDGTITAVNTNNTTAAAGTVLNFASVPAYIAVGMAVGSLTRLAKNGTHPISIGPVDGTQAYVVSKTSTTVTISVGALVQVNNGESIGFWSVTGNNGVPAISYNDKGNSVFKYNYIKNLDEATQTTPANSTTSTMDYRFNLLENMGLHSFAEVHGDYVQMYGTVTNSTYTTVTFGYNSVYNNNTLGGGQGFSIGASSPNVTKFLSVTLDSNSISNKASAVFNYGLTASSDTWVQNWTATNNYEDPTGNAFPTPGSALGWAAVDNFSSAQGPFTTSITSSGNINLLNGAAFGSPL